MNYGNSRNNSSFVFPAYRLAKVPHMFDNVKVIVGSDEDIFEETYVTCVIGDTRTVKFKKSVLVFL